MIRPSDRERASALVSRLAEYAIRPLPGISDSTARDTFVVQLIESVRRIEYLRLLRQRPLSEACASPGSEAFDPIKAAVVRFQQGVVDDAFWFAFLATHFGRHRRAGWRLARDVYGRLGLPGPPFGWSQISARPDEFRVWLAQHETTLRGDGVPRHFGNHRKYETLSPSSTRGTPVVFESYVRWVGPNRGHRLLFEETVAAAQGDPFAAFDALYNSMSAVTSFGRTAKFDYLTLVGNLGLAPIAPGIPYLQGATGPLRGARLLFGGSVEAPLNYKILEQYVVDLGEHTGLGMQVFEDAMCNWQKSPARFVPFRG